MATLSRPLSATLHHVRCPIDATRVAWPRCTFYDCCRPISHSWLHSTLCKGSSLEPPRRCISSPCTGFVFVSNKPQPALLGSHVLTRDGIFQVLPIIAGLVWFGMLLGMLLYWVVDTHEMRYYTFIPGEYIAYISDVGAQQQRPLFIACSCITVVFLDLSFLADRWLRHEGRLVPNTTIREKVLAWMSILFALVGSAGLVLLTIFDTFNHATLHYVFLLLFMAGYCISAIFICWEFRRLEVTHPRHPILRISFWVKLGFVIVEAILAITFIALNFTSRYDGAAVIEWTISFIFTFYEASFFIDLYPATYTSPTGRVTRGHWSHVSKARHLHEREMEEANLF
ncbi:hypothetical protein GQ53DRAFT_887757 [Thozetella sp. PMI_491]|nr:hypothetical protein GQ53DRAFT_887757 [Thozetella sp. PMI_491]